MNGIVQAQTGFPITAVDSLTDIRYMTNRPNQTCDPNANAPHTRAEWFDTSCFQRRPVATTGGGVGTETRNAILGPGFAQTDLSLFKNINVRQGNTIQLRVEGFNIFNQTHFNQPNATIGIPTFGQITSAQDGRVVQLGIKYWF